MTVKKRKSFITHKNVKKIFEITSRKRLTIKKTFDIMKPSRKHSEGGKTMEHNVGMYLTGAEAVKAAQTFTDGHCYRSLYADGVKLAQVEIVLDDVVEVAYIASMENVEKAIKALAENGFSGVPYEVYTETVEGCYAQQTSTGRNGIIGNTTATEEPAQTESKEEVKEMTTLEKIAADMQTY